MEALPLGPDSELGKLALDWRMPLHGFALGILQLMYPGLGAGVTQHSGFFDDPLERILRSVPRIVASVVADDSEQRAMNIRDYHRDIKGVDDQGRKYHAMDPDTYWWAHATFTWGFLRTSDRFHRHPIAGPRREQFYAESVEWYRRYGISTRPVPPSLEKFDERFEQICAEELELTPAAARAVEIALGEPMTVPLLPAPVGKLLGLSTAPVVKLTAIGSLPRVVRDRFDIPWSATDDKAYTALQLAVKNASRLLPPTAMAEVMSRILKQVGAATYLTSADHV